MRFHVMAEEQALTEDRVRQAVLDIDPQAQVFLDPERQRIEVHSMCQPERLAAAIRALGCRLDSSSPTP